MELQSACVGHQHKCKDFVLEPVSSGPKKDADTDLGTRPQPSHGRYLRPEPGGLQPTAKRKHVEIPNFCGRGGRSLTDAWKPALTDHSSATRVSLGRLKAGRAPAQ